MKHTTLWAMIAAGVLLAACGGGGDADTAAAAEPDALAAMPTRAGASVQAFHTALAQMPSDERANPLALDRVNAPTSDTAEPQALD
jgi:hypothetical protein